MTRPLILSALTLLLVGCSHRDTTDATWTQPEAHTSVEPANPVERNGYALLYSVASKNRDVDKILWIKQTSPEVKSLIKQAATLSDEITIALDAAADQGIFDPATRDLPAAEVASRIWIENLARKRLLGDSGQSFERRLVLEQISAMEYLASLASVIGEQDLTPERQTLVDHWARRASHLGSQFVDVLSIAPAPPPAGA